MFQFNNQIYKQINEVSMGSTIAPCMTDICMNRVLNQALNYANSHQPTIFCRNISMICFVYSIMKRSSMIFLTHLMQFTQTLNLQKNYS